MPDVDGKKGTGQNRRFWLIGLILLLALNITVLQKMQQAYQPGLTPDNARLQTPTKEDAQERERVAVGLRYWQEQGGADAVTLIGDLVQRKYSTRYLLPEGHVPMAAWQTEVILKLDHVILTAKGDSFNRDADYVEAGNKDYQSYVDRGKGRRLSTQYCGQQMVQLGLLTNEQTAFVRQRYYSRMRIFHALYNDQFVQAYLQITPPQTLRLAQLRMKARQQHNDLNLWTKDPAERQVNARLFTDINRNTDGDADAILRPQQRVAWSALTSEKPVPEIPADIPELERRKNDVDTDHLDLFTYVSSNSETLGISEQQIEQIQNLKDVIRTGIAAIIYRQEELKAKETPHNELVADFVAYGQEVMLVGVLSQEQERVVRRNLGISLHDRSVLPVQPTI